MKTGAFDRRAVLGGGLATVMLPGAGWGQAEGSEGGIGGTGIVGLLNGFGSLFVGGARVETTERTEVFDSFGRIAERDLRVGDALTVEAVGPQNALEARRVQVVHPLIGQITAVAQDGLSMRVNGTEVLLATPARFGPGQRVLVVGLWDGPQVRASRVVAVSAGSDVLAGTVDQEGFGSRLGSVPVRGAGRIANGGFATLFGRYDIASGEFRTRSFTSGRFRGTEAPLRRLAVEGYLEETREAPGYRVAGLGHSFARNLDLAQFAGSRVLFRGAYTGRFAAEDAIVLPEAQGPRARLLQRLSR